MCLESNHHVWQGLRRIVILLFLLLLWLPEFSTTGSDTNCCYLRKLGWELSFLESYCGTKWNVIVHISLQKITEKVCAAKVSTKKSGKLYTQKSLLSFHFCVKILVLLVVSVVSGGKNRGHNVCCTDRFLFSVGSSWDHRYQTASLKSQRLLCFNFSDQLVQLV